MLHHHHLITALHDRREEFSTFAREWHEGVRNGARRLRELGLRSAEEVRQLAGAPGVRVSYPSAELDEAHSFAVKFKGSWRSHEEARRWALGVLHGRTTFAADGSQIMPGREISLPVAGVQVAWFENSHTGDGKYSKEARFSIITPEELLKNEGGAANAAAVVNRRRTEVEVEALCGFLERKDGWRGRNERLPVAFFDGTFLLSSAHPRTENAFFASYARTVAKMIRLSRETQIPIVGYIDQSYARDLANLLEMCEQRDPPFQVGGRSDTPAIYDAQLLRSIVDTEKSPLESWGDRTIFCYCLREGLTEDFRGPDDQPLVGFTYLQTTGDGIPARLDIPTWVYEAGLLNEVIDTVRAECVVGNGYPYAIETADAAAAITPRDHEQFLFLMQEFTERESFGFQVSRKAISKLHRR